MRTYNYDHIYDIEFIITDDKYGKFCQNIMTCDTETSNGVLQSDGVAIAFDHDLYNSDEDYKSKIDNGTPVSCVYMWQFAIEHKNEIITFLGRDMKSYEEFMNKLTAEIARQSKYGFTSYNRDSETKLAQKCKKYVSIYTYIHNFAFDFQNLRNIYNNQFATGSKKKPATFARSARKPMKSTILINKCKVTFKDSLVLTQKSLKQWGKDAKLSVQKIAVDKDYYLKIRTPLTPLTQLEEDYAVNDVETMVQGIKQYREKYGSLEKIPLTQTGEIRRKCVSEVAEKNPYWAYCCHYTTMHYDWQFFKTLCRLFQGGWTHANAKKANRLLKNLKCFDFASSYPAVMCSRKFPTGDFEECDVSEFDILESDDINDSKYRWFASITLYNIITKLDNTYWSTSKCDELEGVISDNGRVHQATKMTINVTDLDWDDFKQAYEFESFTVNKLYKCEADYLPYELIVLILQYFGYKTSLKGLPDSESLYTESKQFVNSIYGCSVTKIVTDIIDFTENGWKKTSCDALHFFETISLTKEEKTFLSYQIGIWVTAWARHNLWDFILKFDKKIAYCDTDSIKGEFTDEDLIWIDSYNKQIKVLENKVADIVGFDPNLFCPRTSTGKTKRLGIMEREDDAIEFKTLGAKRYAYKTEDGKIHTTIAGLPKAAGTTKIKEVDDLIPNLSWNTKESEKLISYYNDNQPRVKWIDENGVEYVTDEKFGCCLLPTTFDISMHGYDDFINAIAGGETDLTDTPFCLLTPEDV